MLLYILTVYYMTSNTFPLQAADFNLAVILTLRKDFIISVAQYFW